MKKLLSTCLLLGIGSVSFGQVKVKIEGELFNAKATDSIFISKRDDNGTLTNYYAGKLPKGGVFNFQVDVPAEDYYLFRVSEQMIQLIIRNNGAYKVFGDASQLSLHTNIVGSEESTNLQRFVNEVNTWQAYREDIALKSQQNPEMANQFNVESNQKFEEFKVVVNEYYQENMSSPALIGLLNVLNPDQDFKSFEAVVSDLNRSFGQSPTVKSITALYTEKKKASDEMNPLAQGKLAPDFEELMLDRKTKMKLSDLKGKVVLLDFWASWCGPCRKENPNVVALYEKYKNKGFTVMSVSLDDNLDRWKQAIDQDKLSWPNHVSDLKKWQSAAGQKYKVTGIPFTVLIDKEGKIIQTNLRGQDLERVVSQLLD